MTLRDVTDQLAPGHRCGPADRAAEWAPAAFWRATTPWEQARCAKTLRGADTPAYVSEGRWVIDCPDCGSAQMANRTDHRFMCSDCANIAVGGKWRPVVWPGDTEAIESVLEQRPVPNQNWAPGETVEQLAVENLAHGLDAVVDLSSEGVR